MKNTLSIITSIIILISLSTLIIPAQAVSTYNCGDYEIEIINGGRIGDCIITSYLGNESYLEIPEVISSGLISGTVREIGYRSFHDRDFLINITIPKTTELIDISAFEYCPNLEKITISPSVKEIREFAFRGCDKLTIYGYTNTAAETYAKENNIPFESIGVYTEPTTSPTTETPNKTAITTARPTHKPTKNEPTIKTKKATIKKLTPIKKKTLKVTWKKVNGAKGYEIKLATNRKFNKNKRTIKVKKGTSTSKVIKNLKSGKRYYVKIRAYKKVKVDGYTVTANGSWSEIKRSKKIK